MFCVCTYDTEIEALREQFQMQAGAAALRRALFQFVCSAGATILAELDEQKVQSLFEIVINI